MLQPYDPCPCGSGKKFKWCCQTIYADIRKAQEQFERGQHEAALRLLDEMAKVHGNNPEVWGNKANFLAQLGKLEEADAALEKAFAINPNYPNGLLMRARLRLHEGELAGALLLARRAAEAFDPAAGDSLAVVYQIIFDAEMTRQHMPAAHTALALSVRLDPANEQLRQILAGYFGEDGPLPPAARKVYAFRPLKSVEARARWDEELPEVAPTRLAALADLADEVARLADHDPAAWFNLGVARAWAGDHAAALDAIEKSLAHESDDALAREAAALGEVLRLGVGMEEQCDYLQHGFAFNIQDPRAASALLKEWHGAGRLLVQPTEERHVISAILLDAQKTLAVSETEEKAPSTGVFAAYLQIVGTAARVRGPNRESVERLRDTFRERLGIPPGEAEIRTSPTPFHDLILPALVFPMGPESELTTERVQELARKYFVERWIHLPRKSLAGNSPIDATGSAPLKRKLAGVVDFLADCCEGPYLTALDFNLLRHKLGLEPVEVPVELPTPQDEPPATLPIEQPAAEKEPEKQEEKQVEKEPEKQPETPAATETPAEPTPTAPDVPAAALNIPNLNAAELSALEVPALTVTQLEQAYQTALKLDAKELAQHFAAALVERPAHGDKNDRFPLYSYLILRALAEGEMDRAVAYAEAGTAFDAEHNGGRRRDEFDLRKGQALAKKGDLDRAAEVFGGVIERSSDSVKLRVEIIETLLRLKRGKLALKFAQAGIEWAQERNERDAEGHFGELAASARKMGG